MTFYTGATLTLNSGAIFTNAGTTVLTGALTGTSIALSSTYTGLGNFYSGAAGFVSTNTAADGNWVMAADVDVIADLTAGTIVSDAGIEGVTLTNVIQIETPNTSYSAVEVGTEIVPTASFFVINGTGTLTLTSTPTISTMTAVNGQIIEILGGANAVTFQDNGTASGTLLELGDTGRQIGANDILRLRYYDGSWIESYWADN